MEALGHLSPPEENLRIRGSDALVSALLDCRCYFIFIWRCAVSVPGRPPPRWWAHPSCAVIGCAYLSAESPLPPAAASNISLWNGTRAAGGVMRVKNLYVRCHVYCFGLSCCLNFSTRRWSWTWSRLCSVKPQLLKHAGPHRCCSCCCFCLYVRQVHSAAGERYVCVTRTTQWTESRMQWSWMRSFRLVLFFPRFTLGEALNCI